MIYKTGKLKPVRQQSDEPSKFRTKKWVAKYIEQNISK